MLNKLRRLPKVPEQTLKYEDQRLLTLINNLSDGVLALDASLNVVLANGAALSVLNVNEVKGRPIVELVKLVDNTGATVDLGSIISNSTHTFNSDNYRVVYPDGSTTHIYLSISPVVSSYNSGESWGFVMIVRDINKEKLTEEERDEFIGVVGHELLEPLSIAQQSIAKALSIVNDIGASDIAVNSVKTALSQVMFLSVLTNDLAVMSRADRGKLAMSVSNFSISELIQELSNAFTPKATQKDVKLTFISDAAQGNMASSRLYVAEILQNLITNALNYTSGGNIMVSVEKNDSGTQFSVSDTGIGISQADQSKLFSKFFRSEDARVRSLPGTGLGLYLVAKLVKLLDGQITVQSELNKGTTFKLVLPDLPVSQLS